MKQLLLATRNPHKKQELVELLGDLPVAILTLRALDPSFETPEEGETFLENATTKAVEAADAFHMLTLAEDSGLEVDALGGAPGIRSARYARGEGSTDSDRHCKVDR